MSLQKFLIFHRAKVAKAVLWSLLIPALFFCLPQTTANAMDGNRLVEWKSEYNKFEAGNLEASLDSVGMYMAYIQGVAETIFMFVAYAELDADGYGDVQTELLRISQSPLMMNADVTLKQVYAIVGKYLDDNPDQWSKPASVLVRNALFPFEPAK